MKTSRTLLLTFCTLATLSPARATTVIPPTFDELVGRAELIFQGTVAKVTSHWTGEGAQRHIVTYVTLTVDEAIKGDAGATYTLRLLGGTVGDMTMEVTDAPKFVIGDRDILFVENNGTQFVPLVGINHGRFRIQRTSHADTDVVASDHGDPVSDLAKLGKEESAKQHEHSAGASEGALRSADFKAAIRSKLVVAGR